MIRAEVSLFKFLEKYSLNNDVVLNFEDLDDNDLSFHLIETLHQEPQYGIPELTPSSPAHE